MCQGFSQPSGFLHYLVLAKLITRLLGGGLIANQVLQITYPRPGMTLMTSSPLGGSAYQGRLLEGAEVCLSRFPLPSLGGAVVCCVIFSPGGAVDRAEMKCRMWSLRLGCRCHISSQAGHRTFPSQTKHFIVADESPQISQSSCGTEIR